MQIEHDPREPKPGQPSTVGIITTVVILGGGLAVARTDWDAVAASDETTLGTLLFVGGMFLGIGVVAWLLLKAWDWLWARFIGGASR